jgi:glycine/D-amino acid oxidase-like deaminating enzyme
MPNANTFTPHPPSPGTSRSLSPLSPKSTIAVIGAGAFGGWTALSLWRAGFKVTLVDAWGPGNSRSSSGDETRVIRSTYGANEFYFDLNVRSLDLWKENERRFGRHFFYNTGVLWFCYNQKTAMLDDSIPFAKKHAMDYVYLSEADIRKQYPVVNTTDLHHAYFDPFGGYLKAREATQAVQEAFCREGGKFIQAFVLPGEFHSGKLQGIKLSNGDTLQADTYLFACGSWMGQLFPEVLGSVITCTKQEVYYFGLLHNQIGEYESFPVWVDVDGKDFYYGIPGNSHRGFKIGVDKRGEKFDPTTGDRVVSPGVLKEAREFIGYRFPGLKSAPLVESRVCPYENSADGNFIFDRHPEAENVLFLGGGSGHGFKHGPGLGELVTEVLNGHRKIPDELRLPTPGV